MDTSTPVGQALKRSRNSLIIKGAFWILIGLLALIFSRTVTDWMVRLFGVLAIVSAIAGFAAWWPARSEKVSRSLLFQALIDLAIGAVLLLYPRATDIIGIVVGIWLCLHSFSEIEAGFKLRKMGSTGRGRFALGALLLVLGVVIALNPGLVLQSLTWMIALGLIGLGAALVFLGSRMGRAIEKFRQSA